MNKAELEARISEQTGLPKTQVQNVLSAFEDSVTYSLSKGESVKILGFGSFSVQERKARNGRNPKTGEAIVIPASKRPVFKAGKTLANNIK